MSYYSDKFSNNSNDIIDEDTFENSENLEKIYNDEITDSKEIAKSNKLNLSERLKILKKKKLDTKPKKTKSKKPIDNIEQLKINKTFSFLNIFKENVINNNININKINSNSVSSNEEILYETKFGIKKINDTNAIQEDYEEIEESIFNRNNTLTDSIPMQSNLKSFKFIEIDNKIKISSKFKNNKIINKNENNTIINDINKIKEQLNSERDCILNNNKVDYKKIQENKINKDINMDTIKINNNSNPNFNMFNLLLENQKLIFKEMLDLNNKKLLESISDMLKNSNSSIDKDYLLKLINNTINNKMINLPNENKNNKINENILKDSLIESISSNNSKNDEENKNYSYLKESINNISWQTDLNISLN